MPDSPHDAQEKFYGYVDFTDCDWWCRGFNVTKKCAEAIDDFRRAVEALTKASSKNVVEYEATIEQLWEISERVVNLMKWRETENIALIVTLAELYEESVEQITKESKVRTPQLSFHTGVTHSGLKQKGENIRAEVAKMCDVRCCRE